MREIKFRAWYPRNHKFNVCNTHIDGTGLLFWQFGYNCDVIEKEERDEVVIQFYTGLKDKNGKEIYEGDIVKPKSKFVSVGYEVYWDDRTCQFRLCARGNRQFDKTHDLRIWADEIVGNIYENPELLEKGND